MKKRILSLAMCLCMVLGLLPATALAADGDPTVAICGTTLESGGKYVVSGTNAVTQDDTATANYLGYTADAITGTLTVHGDVSLEIDSVTGINVTGTVTINTGTADDSLAVTSTKSGIGALFLSDSAVTLTGSGDLTLNGVSSPVAGSPNTNQLLTDKFSGDVTISCTGTESGNAINFIDGEIQLTTAGAITMQSGSSLPTVGSQGNLTLSGSSVTLQNSGAGALVESLGNISITSTSDAADLTLTGSYASALLSATGSVTLISSKDLSLQNNSTGGALSATGGVSATAAGAVTMGSGTSTATIDSNGNIALQGAAVSLTNSGTGNLANTAGGDISITSTSETADLTLTGLASSNLLSANNGSGTVTLSCGGDLTINDSAKPTMLINGGLTVTKAENVNISGACAGTVISGDLNISGVTGNVKIAVNVGGYQIGGDADITAAGDVTLINSYNTSSSPVIQGIATITSTTGSIDIEGANSTEGGYVIAGNGADTGSVTATFTAAKRIVALNLSPDNTDVTKQSNLCPLTDDCYTIWTMSAEDAGTLAWQYRYGGKALDTSGIDIPQEGTTPTCNTAYAAGDGWVLWRPTLTEDVVTGGTVELEDVTIPYALVLPANVTLELTGTNTVNGPISAAGDLTVVGPGSLNIVTDKLAGISATGSVTVESGTVDVNMNTAETNARGIYSQTSVTVNGGAVTVELQSSAANAYGVMAGTGVAVSGGTFDVTAKSTAAEGAILSGGLFTMGPTTFSGGNVTVSADSFAVCSMGAITLESGMRETGGNVVCSGTIEDTGAAAVYTFAAEGKTFTTNAEMKTVAAKSIELKQRGTLSVFTTDADAHYDVGDTITANIVVSALEDTGKTVNSANFTLDYDKTNLTLNEITVADGWTTDTVDGATRMIETTSEGKSVPEGGLVIAAATFTVNAGAADNTSTAITVTDPELKITGENDGFTPAVAPAPVTLHNIVVTLQQPEAGATLTGSTTAYAKYGVKGLYSDTGRTEKFTMPTVTATTGYRLAKDGEPRWTMIMVPYYSDEAVMDAVYTVSTTLTVYVVKTYNVTVTATAGGSLSSDESPLILDLGSGLLDQLPTATADSNHTFAGWYIKAANETGTDTLVNETTSVTGDMTVEARFTAKSYTWTAPTGDNFTCTVSGGVSDDNQISYGTPIHFTLTAAEGYVIDTVTYQVGTANAVTITPTDGTYTIPGDQITGNVTATVTAVQRCTITFESVTGATLSGTLNFYGKIDQTGLYADEACTSRIMNESALPTIAYDSGNGWRYAATTSNIWSYTGKSSGTCTSADLLGNRLHEWRTNVGDITVKPNVVKQYLITLKVDDENHATMYKKGSTTETTSWAEDGNYLVNMGEPTITYAPGYVFKSFTFGGTEYTTWSNGGFWMDSVKVTKADTLTLNTQPGTYAVTFPETITGATISDKTGLDDTTNKATYLTPVTFKVTASEGYTVGSVTYTVGSGEAAVTKTITPDTVSGIYTIPGTAITDAVSVAVNTTKLHKVQFVNTAETPHGSLSGTTTFYLTDGTKLTADQLAMVTVMPDTGYELKYWTVNDAQTVPTDCTVTADTTFTAVFGPASYIVYISEGMTATVDGQTYHGECYITVSYGTDIVLTPDADSNIVSVIYSDSKYPYTNAVFANGVYTIPGTVITANLIVIAKTLSDKGFTLRYISAEQYMALATDTMIAVLTPITDDANGAAVKSITTSGGEAFYWSDRYDAFVKIVDSTATAETICGGLTFSSDGEKNAIAYTGDITGDGKITAADAAVANEILHNSARADTTELMRLKCDVTDNDTTGAKIVTSDDILWILKRPGVIA